MSFPVAVDRLRGSTGLGSPPAAGLFADNRPGVWGEFADICGVQAIDGVYDRGTRMRVKALLGQAVGSPGYRWDLDVNSDGKIDATDELAAVRNWGKAV